MPKFLIERRIPNAGELSLEELSDISGQSNRVIQDMRRRGMGVQWQHSYVLDNALYCVYIADNKDAIMEHARCGGFPADNVMEVKTRIDPTTGE